MGVESVHKDTVSSKLVPFGGLLDTQSVVLEESTEPSEKSKEANEKAFLPFGQRRREQRALETHPLPP